jgi:glucose-1-phosphate cytidylyltransferase
MFQQIFEFIFFLALHLTFKINIQMKVVLFAGGIGSRISEESHLRPKPMIEIGGKPIIWHIMKLYAAQGFNEFVICLGYKGHMIKEYFYNYYLQNTDFTVDVSTNQITYHKTAVDHFKITLIDTGLHTKTAGRLKQVKEFIGEETFMLTYGDGVADVNIKALLQFHQSHGKLATVTAVKPPTKFGTMEVSGEVVTQFREKSKEDGSWINGGFFVLEPAIFDYLKGSVDEVMWEDYPLENLSNDGQLMAYHHEGFWKCMDALRDKNELEELWETNQAKWKNW